MAPFICGAVVADGVLFGGETWRGYMEVDTDICYGGAVFSLVSMLGEYGVSWDDQGRPKAPSPQATTARQPEGSRGRQNPAMSRR